MFGLRTQLGSFDNSFAFVQAEFRIRRALRDHGYGAVVPNSKEDARRQKSFRLTYLRFQRLTGIQFCLPNWCRDQCSAHQ